MLTMINKLENNHEGILYTFNEKSALRLPCTFRGVCSRTDVAAPDYSPDTPNPMSI